MSISSSARPTISSSARDTASCSPATVNTERLWLASDVRSSRNTPAAEVSASARRSTTSDRRPSETLGTLSTSTPRCYSPALAAAWPPGGTATYTRSSMTERRRSLLHHPDFLKLWTAETVSVFGTAITQLALPLIAATVLSGQRRSSSACSRPSSSCRSSCSACPAGVWVDRLRRRPILIVGDLGRAVAIASIPIAFYFDALTIWQLYVVGFINGCLTVFFDVAYQSYLPSLVERDQLVEGNSKLEITRSAAQILGPGLAGVLIGVLRAPFAMVIDSISYFVSAFFVFLIRRPEPPVAPHDEAAARPEALDAHRRSRSASATSPGTAGCARSPPRRGRRTSSAT